MDEIESKPLPPKKETLSVPKKLHHSTPMIPLSAAKPAVEAVKMTATPVSTTTTLAEPTKAEVIAEIKAESSKLVEEPAKAEETVKAEVAEEKDEKKEREAARWAALAKKERDIELRNQAFKTDQKAVEAQKLENTKFQNEILSIKNNPKLALDILEKLEIPFHKLAQYVLNPAEVDKDYEVKRLRDQYESDKYNREKFEKDSLTKQQETNIIQFKSNLKTFIDGNNDAYELIRATNAYEALYDRMNESFRKTGIEPKLEDSAKELEESLYHEALILTKAKKLSRISESESKAETEMKDKKEIKASGNNQLQKATKAAKPTLTNSNTVYLTTPIGKATSEKERRARAMAAIRNK